MIHYINLDKKYTDRFDMAKFLNFSNGVHDILTSYFLYKLSDLPVRGKFEITFESGRPEFLSYLLYKDVQYWWLLMEYNNLLDIYDLKQGLEIKYFSINELEDLYFSLVSNENSKKIDIANSFSQTKIIDLGTISNSNLINSTDHVLYTFTNLQLITIDHLLNKRPTVIYAHVDNDGNEIEEEIFVKYPVGFQTSRVIIDLGSIKSGVIILN